MSARGNNASNIGAPLGNTNAVGNAGGGAPFENSNAVGNSGGGAPEANTNSRSHGVYCDLEKIDERAEGEIAKFIDEMETLIRKRSNENPGRKAREIPLRMIRHSRAIRNIQHQGLILSDGSLNPRVAASRRILNRIFDDLQEIEVL